MRVFLPNRSQELLGDYCAVCCCKSSLCVHSLIKYNSKGCHRLKELQKCLVSSATPEYPCGSSSETGGIHRRRAVTLHVSLPPDPRVFLGSPGAGTWSLHPSLTWSFHPSFIWSFHPSFIWSLHLSLTWSLPLISSSRDEDQGDHSDNRIWSQTKKE